MPHYGTWEFFGCLPLIAVSCQLLVLQERKIRHEIYIWDQCWKIDTTINYLPDTPTTLTLSTRSRKCECWTLMPLKKRRRGCKIFRREAKTKSMTQMMLTQIPPAGVRVHTPLVADRHQECSIKGSYNVRCLQERPKQLNNNQLLTSARTCFYRYHDIHRWWYCMLPCTWKMTLVQVVQWILLWWAGHACACEAIIWRRRSRWPGYMERSTWDHIRRESGTDGIPSGFLQHIPSCSRNDRNGFCQGIHGTWGNFAESKGNLVPRLKCDIKCEK